MFSARTFEAVLELELNLKSIVLAALVAGIIALAALNAYFFWNPPEKNSVSFYRSFAEKNHWQMQAALEDAKSTLEQASLEGFQGEAKERMALLNAFNASALGDVEWLAAEEAKAFEPLSKTENNLEALALMKKEVASFVLSGYVFLLNSSTIKSGMQEYFDENALVTPAETIQEAELAAEETKVGDVLNDEVALMLIEETGLKKEQIGEAVKEAFEAYWEKRKRAFSAAQKGALEEFVEAKKLLEFAFVLESQ